MITSSRDQKAVEAKQEGDADGGKFLKAAVSTSRQWSAFRNPRIVRVSRTFGGKDRHSKVCTIRGLRDRRIRLSVPTAIQLYDLQHRLGLGQPSKVIDWLLDASKDDIDKLPSLQLPQGFDHQFHHHRQMLVSNEFSQSLNSSLAPFPDANCMLIKHGHHHLGLHSLGMKTSSGLLEFEDQSSRANSKQRDAEASLRAKGKWVKANIEQGYHDGVCNYSGNSTTTGQVSAQRFFPLATNSSLPGYGILNNSMPFNSCCHLDSSSLSLSQFGSHGFLCQQAENPLNNNDAVSFPIQSSFALSTGSQFFFCPPPTMSSIFPPFCNPYGNGASAGDRREANNFQLLATSSSQQTSPSSRARSSSTRPDSLSVNPGLVHLPRNEESRHGKINNAMHLD